VITLQPEAMQGSLYSVFFWLVWFPCGHPPCAGGLREVGTNDDEILDYVLKLLILAFLLLFVK